MMPLHRYSRRKKVQMFFGALNPSPSDTLLDIGGSIGMTGEFSKLYGFFNNVSTLNLEPEPVGSGHATFIQGDACQMPLPSNSFDYVFSNAVIEHVGDFSRQRRMAQEVARVARKGYFITTPNRNFPIDPHSYLPFYHLLSLSARRRLAEGILKRYLGGHEEYWMLSARQMRELFPTATVVSGPTITAFQRKL
jgi:ubiquinone/menaquinone biosynthesis C-methylase UbiE